MKEIYVNNVPGQGDRPAGTCYIRLGNINVGLMSGRANEVVEMLTRRMFAVCRKLDGVVVQHGRSKEKTVFINSFGVVTNLDLEVMVLCLLKSGLKLFFQ